MPSFIPSGAQILTFDGHAKPKVIQLPHQESTIVRRCVESEIPTLSIGVGVMGKQATTFIFLNGATWNVPLPS